MRKQTKILVVGGGNVEQGADGGPVTKIPIAEYLLELSDRFGHCVWLVARSGTWGVTLEGATSRVTGRLDPERVTVVTIDDGFRGTLRNCMLLLRHALDRPYGIFFLPQIMTMVPVLPIARLFLARFVVYLAGDYELTLRDTEFVKTRWFGWALLYRASYEGAMRMADGVVARGSHLAGLARRCNANVIQTVPLGHMHSGGIVDHDELDPDAPRRLLYVGLLIESKGMEDLMHALRMILDRRRGARIHLDVLGDGPDRERFEAFRDARGLAEDVTFHGWVEDRAEIEEFFAGTHCLVMPSSTHPEGVPRSIDEALVRRIPVVATRIAGVPLEFANGEVLLVDVMAPEQLADGIESVLYDPIERRRYVEGAERRRRQWGDHRSAAEQHSKFLRQEIGGSGLGARDHAASR